MYNLGFTIEEDDDVIVDPEDEVVDERKGVDEGWGGEWNYDEEKIIGNIKREIVIRWRSVVIFWRSQKIAKTHVIETAIIPIQQPQTNPRAISIETAQHPILIANNIQSYKVLTSTF